MITLDKIKTIDDFVEFIPHIIAAIKASKLEMPCSFSEDSFARDLISRFSRDEAFYGKVNNGELIYFVAVSKLSEEERNFWIFYVNVVIRNDSTELVKQVVEAEKLTGAKVIYFQTSKFSSSYRRWVSKFDAKPHSITYKIEVN